MQKKSCHIHLYISFASQYQVVLNIKLLWAALLTVFEEAYNQTYFENGCDNPQHTGLLTCDIYLSAEVLEVEIRVEFLCILPPAGRTVVTNL